MKVVLVVLHSKYIHNSLALPYLANYCADVASFEIVEGTVHEPKENLVEEILRHNPDVVAFSVYLWNRRETLDLVDMLGVMRPELNLVLGGPEVSFEDAEIFTDHPALSAIIHGEGERPLKGYLELLNSSDFSQIPVGVSCRVPVCAAEGVADTVANTVIMATGTDSIARLDDIPSPFQAELVDLSRGFVYFETSRGCPYRCSFCMSALDDSVRSFSMERIKSDLLLLMEADVPKIKLVDRTFNYDAKRTREIFSFILQHNRSSHFHFEIGAHLLDEVTIGILEKVPEGVFQFEIGLQSTLPETLDAVGRSASAISVINVVKELKERTKIELHLDLIWGLPKEGYEAFLQSVDNVLAVGSDHLQLEAVKVLPGSILRSEAKKLQIRFDPNPPYTIAAAPELTLFELQQLRRVSRILDLLYNSHRCGRFVQGLSRAFGSIAQGLVAIADYWQQEGLFRFSLSQRDMFDNLWKFIQTQIDGEVAEFLRDLLANDYALLERVIPGRPPEFFRQELSVSAKERVDAVVGTEFAKIKGSGVKFQHYADTFSALPDGKLRLFLYLIRPQEGMEVREIIINE